MPHTFPTPNSTFLPPAARYYQSTHSFWLSVDPLADKYPNLSPYAYCAGNPVRYFDEDGRDWYAFENPDTKEMEIKWTDYHSQRDMNDNGIEGKYLGAAAILFSGSENEKLGTGYSMFGEGAILATATVYGPGGKDDIQTYKAYTMSSDFSTFGAIAEGTYSFNYDAKGKSGNLTSHWTINNRGNVAAMGGNNPNPNSGLKGTPYKNGIFIHRPNQNGFAGTYQSGGKTHGVSEGCLLIIPSQYDCNNKPTNNGWDQFNKQLSGVKNGTLILKR